VRATKPREFDLVNWPAHYNTGSIQPIDAIEDWELGFHEANAVKYIARAKHKGSELQDLQKARWYLDRRIDQLIAAEQASTPHSTAPHSVVSCANCQGVGRVSAIGLQGVTDAAGNTATEPCQSCDGKGSMRNEQR
jgi:hypothetical protein